MHFPPGFPVRARGRECVVQPESTADYLQLRPLTCSDVAYVMDTFPIVRRHDEKEHDYRTKLTILDHYDVMAKAMAAGTQFVPKLAPTVDRSSLP